MAGALEQVGKTRAGEMLILCPSLPRPPRHRHGCGHGREGWRWPWPHRGEAGSAAGDGVGLGHTRRPAAPCLGGEETPQEGYIHLHPRINKQINEFFCSYNFFASISKAAAAVALGSLAAAFLAPAAGPGSFGGRGQPTLPAAPLQRGKAGGFFDLGRSKRDVSPPCRSHSVPRRSTISHEAQSGTCHSTPRAAPAPTAGRHPPRSCLPFQMLLCAQTAFFPEKKPKGK